MADMVNTRIGNQRQHLYRFVCDYLAALGASVIESEGIIRAELTPEQLAELEGRTGPRYVTWGQEEEQNRVLYLTLDADLAEQHPEAELIIPGSHRLEQMVASTRKRGRVAQLTLHRPGVRLPEPRVHHVALVLDLRITFEGRVRQERILTACVDLTSGRLRPDIPDQMAEGQLVAVIPDRVKPLRLSLDDAWEIARSHCMAVLSAQDDGWARESLLALAQERRALERFYAEHSLDSGLALCEEREIRIAEAERRSRPRAIVRPSQLLMLFSSD